MKQQLLKKLRLLLSVAAVTLLIPLPMAAQTRIAVVSDIHVMAPGLLPSGAESQDAWINYYAGQRKMLDKSAAIFDQFVNAMKTASPKILLITGDLTKDGEQVSHDYVKTKLAELEDEGIQCYVIPGNHDFGEEGNHTQFIADGTTANAEVLSASNFATSYANYGYSEGTPDPNGSLSYVAEPVSGLVLLAIDSHSGSIGANTLTWICSKASQARANGKQVIAMMHHPLFPHITGADLFIDTYTVGSYETVRNKLINAGVNVILTGHFHTSDIAKDWNDDANKAIYDINTGSLISYPCDYRMLTLSADKTTLDVATTSLEETTALRPDEATSWKDWLQNRLKRKAEAKMNEEAGNMATTLSTYIDNLSTFAANLFILHAEGDENSETHVTERANLETTYTGYKNDLLYSAALSYGGITDASVYSILDDKSNYGGAHENQTADRKLNINLPASTVLNEAVTIPASGWATYCTGHDVDISLTSGLTAYTVSAVDATKATLTEVTKIPAEEGFMLKGAAGNYTLKPATTDVSAVTNLLKGTLVAIPGDGYYALATKGEPPVTAFYPVKAGVNIPAHKAYISIPAGARMLSLGGDGGTTDIQFIEKGLDNDAEQPIYTLQGTRASSLRPGIYIQNGKKVVIK